MTFTIGHIALVSRGSFHDPFRIRWEVPIGSAGSEHISEHGPRSCRQVDVPYVAACGSGLQAADTDLVRGDPVRIDESGSCSMQAVVANACLF